METWPGGLETWGWTGSVGLRHRGPNHGWRAPQDGDRARRNRDVLVAACASSGWVCRMHCLYIDAAVGEFLCESVALGQVQRVSQPFEDERRGAMRKPGETATDPPAIPGFPKDWREQIKAHLANQLASGGTLYGFRSDGAHIARTSHGDRILALPGRDHG